MFVIVTVAPGTAAPLAVGDRADDAPVEHLRIERRRQASAKQ